MISSPRRSLWNRASALGIIAGAAIVAYSNSFGGPFVFDGANAIVDNASIRHLWPLGAVLRPPADGSPVSGRPLTNLTFALNYALGGLNVGGYHVANLALHLLAAGLLFGIIRRTVQNTALAAAAALLWTVHPLHTDAGDGLVCALGSGLSRRHGRQGGHGDRTPVGVAL